MPQHEPIITLSIQETGQASQRVFLYHVRVDEEVIASNQQLSTAASQTIRDVSRQYNQLFEQRYAPHLATENLQVLGAELFNTWLAPNSVRLNFCRAVELSDASGQYERSIQLPWPIH